MIDEFCLFKRVVNSVHFTFLILINRQILLSSPEISLTWLGWNKLQILLMVIYLWLRFVFRWIKNRLQDLRNKIHFRMCILRNWLTFVLQRVNYWSLRLVNIVHGIKVFEGTRHKRKRVSRNLHILLQLRLLVLEKLHEWKLLGVQLLLLLLLVHYWARVVLVDKARH